MIHNHFLVPERVSVVGPGRLGGALVTALRVAGLQVTGPHGRGDPAAPADAVLLCVPDAEIEAAALAAAGAAPLIGHTSGATGLDALTAAGGEAFGLHPLQTFVGGEGLEAFSCVGCAVAGTSPGALTGPVARGDGETVERQRAAVAESAPGFLALFDAMVERTQALSAPGVAA